MMTIDWTGETQVKEKWLEWRSKGIGSSDIPIILGLSPWKTEYQLWLEKTNIRPSDFSGNWATRRGTELEPIVRDWYNEKYNTSMQPENRESKENSIFRASADGYDPIVNRLIEIKCPNIGDHKMALNGEVPEKYRPQIQWLMLVFDCPSIDYISFNNGHAVVTIKEDRPYQQYIKEKALEFWNKVEKLEPPSCDEEYLDSPKLEKLLSEYSLINTQISNLKKKLADLNEEIKSNTNASKTYCKDSTLEWIERKGLIDYNSIPQLKDVDLEKYRRKSTRYFAVKQCRSK